MLVNDINESKLFKIQDIIIMTDTVEAEVKNLYYKSKVSAINDQDGGKKLLKGIDYDFFTYFNSFSVEKWKKYTNIKNIYLVLEASGDFIIELFGHYKKKDVHHKELIATHDFSEKDTKTIILSFPEDVQSSLFGFFIMPKTDVIIKRAYFATDVDESAVRKPFISMVTTTFKKESYVKKNIGLLNSKLLSDEEYRDGFCWTIVDNGRTIDPEELEHEKIKVVPNRNVGGAGGFARGMMESFRQDKKPTHILLMDDDVVFVPESFKRLYKLLSLVKDEYKDYFISGAMLKMSHPNIQHEDIGVLNEEGYHEALKPNYDLTVWADIVNNEVIKREHYHQYAAWWFCCIPANVAGMDNLPLPVFFRGDDVEYSLRNHAEIIIMNGICIWHEGFEGKFSAALEYYQVNRNELAVRAMHPDLHDVDCIGHIKQIFWEEVYKFNYKGAALLLDAVEDYMKGPDYLFNLDGEKVMKDKKARDNRLKPLTAKLKSQIDMNALYDFEPVNTNIKKIYDYTYNGQARIPEMFLKKKTGVIPYGWGYNPGKIVLTDKNIAVDPVNEKYVVFKKSRSKFNEIKARYERIIGQYDREHTRIEKEYQDKATEITGERFWDEYLK